MKAIEMKANLLEGVATTISALSVQTKAETVGGDVVKAVEEADKVVAEIYQANSVFHDEVSRIQSLKEEKYKEFTKLYEEKVSSLTPEEKSKVGAEMTAELQREINEIQKQSEAKPDEVVKLTLSDDKQKSLASLFRKTVGSWTDSKMFVEAGNAIDNASEA